MINPPPYSSLVVHFQRLTEPSEFIIQPWTGNASWGNDADVCAPLPIIELSHQEVES